MKKIQPLIQVLSIYVLALALFKVYVYYNNFNIPIKYFINISELTVTIFEDLLYIIPALAVLYFMTDKTDTNIDFTETKIRIRDSFNFKFTGRNFKENLRLLLRKIFIILYLLLFFGFPLFLIFFRKNYSEKIFGFSVLGILIVLILIITKSNQLKKSLTINGRILSTILLLLTFIFIIKLLSDIQYTENGKFVGTKIITEDSTYVSTPDYYYIGQTSTYIFFFDKNQNKPTIIPASKIKRIELSIRKN